MFGRKVIYSLVAASLFLAFLCLADAEASITDTREHSFEMVNELLQVPAGISIPVDITGDLTSTITITGPGGYTWTKAISGLGTSSHSLTLGSAGTYTVNEDYELVITGAPTGLIGSLIEPISETYSSSANPWTFSTSANGAAGTFEIDSFFGNLTVSEHSDNISVEISGTSATITTTTDIDVGDTISATTSGQLIVDTDVIFSGAPPDGGSQNGVGTDVDIAICTIPNWISQEAADREANEIVQNVSGHVNDIRLFGLNEDGDLANWVTAHTNNGQLDVLILFGVFPNSIYPGGNAQPDASIAENFLDAGNMIINTADYIFYVSYDGWLNNIGGLQNMMDQPNVSMMYNLTPVQVTSAGSTYLPSLADYTTDRALDLTTIEDPWEVEAVFAQSDDGNFVEPFVVHNVNTGGRLATFYQLIDDNAPRGEVISEFLLNWMPEVIDGTYVPPSNGDTPVGPPADLEGLIAYWDFNEGQGTTVHDSAGNNDGTINGTPLWTDGYFDGGLEFDGSINFVDCGAGPDFDLTDEFTIAAWIKVDEFGAWDGIITKGVESFSFSMELWEDGALRFAWNWGILTGAYGTGAQNSNTQMSAGSWYHTAITYDGSVGKLYINGTADAMEVNHSITFGTNSESLILGCDLPGGDEYFDGVMDEVRIYDRALTGAEINQLMGGSAPPNGTTPLAITSEPTATSVTDNSAVITWSTNRASSSLVEYALYGSDDNLLATGADNTTSHSVTITGLSPETTYFYAVLSVDSSGNRVESDGDSFTTAAQSTSGGFILVGTDPDDGIVPNIDQTFVYSDGENISFRVTTHRPWDRDVAFYIDIDWDQNPDTGFPTDGTDCSIGIVMENGEYGYGFWVYDPSVDDYVSESATLSDVRLFPNESTFEVSIDLAELGDPDAIDFLVWMMIVDIGDYAPKEGLYTYTIPSSSQTADRTLSITSAEGSPDSTATVKLNISDATGIAGGDIFIRYDPGVLAPGDITSTSLLSGITPVINDSVPGEIKIGMAGTQGIPSGSGTLMNIAFIIEPSIQTGTQTVVQLSSADMYGSSGADIPVNLQNGTITVTQPGIKGDVNGDGFVRSNDAILTLQIATGILAPSDYQIWASDMNGDGNTRSNDAILILGKAVGLTAPHKHIIAKTGGEITAMLAEAHGVAGEIITLPLRFDNIAELAGGDICITYNPDVLRAVEVSPESDILLAANTTEPGLIRLGFANGGKFNSRTIANVKFEVLADDISPLKFTSVNLYNRGAVRLNSRGIDEEFRSWAIPPEQSTLLQNFPNPFNPETWIPYQIRTDSEITIRIYSVTGELVRELALGHKSAGLYVSRDRAAYWDGKDKFGIPASSGIYFYSIQAGDFATLRKLSILK